MMSENITLETKVIERFVIQSKRDRYISFLKTAKNRSKLINELFHSPVLREEFFEKVKCDERQFVKEKAKAFTDCYLMSENSELDQKRMNIDYALSEIIGFGMGTLAVFGDAEMVFYEGEGPSDRWISKV